MNSMKFHCHKREYVGAKVFTCCTPLPTPNDRYLSIIDHAKLSVLKDLMLYDLASSLPAMRRRKITQVREHQVDLQDVAIQPF